MLVCFRLFWITLAVLGVLLARFALFWVVLAHFGSFRLVLGRYLCSYWPNIMQSSSTFIRISGFIPEVKKKKKICIDQLFGKYCILGRIRAKRGVDEQVCFVTNTVGGF